MEMYQEHYSSATELADAAMDALKIIQPTQDVYSEIVNIALIFKDNVDG